MRRVALVICVTALALSTAAPAGAANGYQVSKATASKWMTGYLDAWKTRDTDAVVKLFTPNGV